MIVTSNVAQSIVGMNIIGPRRLVMDPVTCTVDFRDEGTAAARGVLGHQKDGTIADVRVLKAITIPKRHGQLLKLGLFNAEHHRVHASGPTLVDMDIMAAAVNTDAMHCDLSQHSHRCFVFGSPYGLSGQWAYILLGQFHLIECKIFATGIAPDVATID
jgi:hypothetical protein